MGARVREANAKIQFGGDFSRIDRPTDIDRTFIKHLVGFSKAAECPLEVTYAKGKKEKKKRTKAELLAGIDQHHEDVDCEQLQGWLSELQRKAQVVRGKPGNILHHRRTPRFRRE